MNIRDKTKLRLEREVDPLLSDIDAAKVMLVMGRLTNIWQGADRAGAWYKPWEWQPQLDAFDLIISRAEQLSMLTSVWSKSYREKDA